MKRSRRAVALFVAAGSAAFIFAAAGHAIAQTDDCDARFCHSEDFDREETSNDSGATVVFEDGGSADVDNDEGAVLVHADDGSVSVVNDEGAVAAWADGGSASVFNDEGAVVVHSDDVRRRASSGGSFFGGHDFDHDGDRVVHIRTVTRLPVTGGSVFDVVAMAVAMIGIGAILLATARIIPRFGAARAG